MTEESKKRGISPFTIVLAGIIAAVAITLPLGNRISDQAEAPTVAPETTSEVADSDSSSILMIDGQPVQVDVNQHPGAVAVSQQLQIVQLQLNLMETQLELMQHKLDTLLEIQGIIHDPPNEE